MSNKELMKVIMDLRAEVLSLKAQLKTSQKLKYYGYKEAALILGISIEGLKTRIKRGQMIRTCNNNRPLIAHAEIERFLRLQNPDGIVGAFYRIVINLLYVTQKHFVVYCLFVHVLMICNG